MFAVYLAHVNLSSNNLRKLKLNDVVLGDRPVLCIRDIVTYIWNSHEIYLTDEAGDRITTLNVSTTGLPFVVCVGEERMYSGAFWVSWSSMSFDGVVVEITLPQIGSRKIRLQLGYPESPELFLARDPRFDPRIKEALRKAQKLK